MHIRFATLACALALGIAAPAGADILPGAVAPPFTKNALDAPPPAARSLSDYAGKVVVLFLLGYNCPVCLGDAPAVESDVSQYYANAYPGQVQVLGADVWNGTSAGLRDFRDQTGVTFPLLLLGASPTGGDLTQLYGPFDNYVVINKQGIVRYHAARLWPHGNRYHLGEIRGTIDSLVSAATGVGDPLGLERRLLTAAPNPFQGTARLELALPERVVGARVSVFDVTGREIDVLHEGPLAAGTARFRWDGRDAAGRRAAAGVYLVSADLDGARVQRRVVLLP